MGYELRGTGMYGFKQQDLSVSEAPFKDGRGAKRHHHLGRYKHPFTGGGVYGYTFQPFFRLEISEGWDCHHIGVSEGIGYDGTKGSLESGSLLVRAIDRSRHIIKKSFIVHRGRIAAQR